MERFTDYNTQNALKLNLPSDIVWKFWEETETVCCAHGRGKVDLFWTCMGFKDIIVRKHRHPSKGL